MSKNKFKCKTCNQRHTKDSAENCKESNCSLHTFEPRSQSILTFKDFKKPEYEVISEYGSGEPTQEIIYGGDIWDSEAKKHIHDMFHLG